MSDFITLACPSCGGQLKVASNATALVCEHCGNEHLVRRDAGSILLESYARCPRCGRNDQVQKVTSILSSHTQKITGTDRRVEVYVDQGKTRTRTVEVPITRTQITDLASRLSSPPRPSLQPEPRNSAGCGMVAIGVLFVATSIIVGIPGLLAFLYPGTDSATGPLEELLAQVATALFICVFPLVLVAGAGILLIYLGSKKRKTSEEDYQARLAEVRASNQSAEERWRRAMQRWKSLYYCYRDDCVFVPSEGTCAQLPQMQNYLYER